MGLYVSIACLVGFYLAMFFGVWWLRGRGFRELLPWGRATRVRPDDEPSRRRSDDTEP